MTHKRLFFFEKINQIFDTRWRINLYHENDVGLRCSILNVPKYLIFLGSSNSLKDIFLINHFIKIKIQRENRLIFQNFAWLILTLIRETPFWLQKKWRWFFFRELMIKVRFLLSPVSFGFGITSWKNQPYYVTAWMVDGSTVLLYFSLEVVEIWF